MSAFHGVVLCFLSLLPSAQAMTQLDHATATMELASEAGPRSPVEVTLPYNWNSQLGGARGKARFTIRFPANPDGPQQALFIRRIGNSFEVVFNGELLEKGGVHGDLYTDSTTRPRLFIIPPHLLRSDNTIEITIGAVGGRGAGVGLVHAGTVEEMRRLHRQAFRWRNSSYLVILAVSSVLGGLAFLLWLRQREDLYLYYALSELIWAIHIADMQFEASPLPWPWWGIIGYSCYALAPGFICKFSLTLAGQHHGWIRRLSDFHLWLSVPVIALALLGYRPGLVSIWLGLTILLCTAVAVKVMRQGFRSSSLEQRILAVAVAITSIAAIRDMIVFRILPGYGGFPSLVFAWAAFGVCLAWLIAERLRKSAESAAAQNRNLAQQLAQREEELKILFQARAFQDRQQAVTEERQRIMRDMHDGLGSELVSAVRLVNDPDVPRGMLAEQLQDVLDNLKLTVDAMQDTEGDIAMLLGTLRYRLSPRFAAIGVALSWDVRPLPAVHDWTIQKSRHLQLILFEAMSNVIAHAHATRAHLSAEHRIGKDSEEIIISLKDNGAGFRDEPPSGKGGQGLANIRSRAASIGATVRILSSSEGTLVELTIPVRTVSR